MNDSALSLKVNSILQSIEKPVLKKEEESNLLGVLEHVTADAEGKLKFIYAYGYKYELNGKRLTTRLNICAADVVQLSSGTLHRKGASLMQFILRQLIIVSVILINSSAFGAETIDMAKVKNKVTIDLRKEQSSNNLFMVIFFARKPASEKDSKVGHAYAATLEFHEDTDSFVETGVFGLYPKEKAWHLGKFPGKVDLTELDANPNVALLSWVNKPEYEKVLALRLKWEKKGTWQALQGDCVSMMSETAKEVGLKVPNRGQGILPYDFLTNLVRLNRP